MTRKIAVVGAGVAGSMCARGLADLGIDVLVFDKGRSIGGRLAQRRRDGAVFDYGAQFIRARDPRLTQFLEAGVASGTVARWPAAEADGRPVYVGQPSMAAPFKTLLADLPVVTDCRIETLTRSDASWWLTAADGSRYGAFDDVVLAVPAPQARDLLLTAGSAAPASLVEAAARAVMAPCWALLLAFDPFLDLDGFDARSLPDGPIAWIARNTSKPRRGDRETWTVHASSEWSSAHLEEAPVTIAGKLLPAFREIVGTSAAEPAYCAAHRWRFALVTKPLGETALGDRSSRIGLCGDWCVAGKVEAAFLSGGAMVELLTS